jgi:inorganic triphosphatase YgiF
MHEELELKLAVTPDELKRLRRDPLIRSLAHKRASTKRLHSTYFDTPSHDLHRRGMALRVRHIGKRRVQTLKVPGKGTSGLQHYREYEAELEADTPDVARIEDETLRRLFDAEGLTGRLTPVFTTAFSRSSVPLKLEDSEVELALDSGEIAAGGQSLPICEAELELVSGASERIYELALALHKRIDFRLETRTKAARGYQLTTGLRPCSQKAKVLDLHADLTVGEAFIAAARSCLEQIRVNSCASASAACARSSPSSRRFCRRSPTPFSAPSWLGCKARSDRRASGMSSSSRP